MLSGGENGLMIYMRFIQVVPLLKSRLVGTEQILQYCELLYVLRTGLVTCHLSVILCDTLTSKVFRLALGLIFVTIQTQMHVIDGHGHNRPVANNQCYSLITIFQLSQHKLI